MDNIIDKSITVGTSAVEVHPELLIGQKKAMVLTNTSTGGQKITISRLDSPQAGLGVVLYPGANYVESIDSHFLPSSKRTTAIADGAGGTLAVFLQIGRKL